MADATLYMGGDLQVSASGDLLTANGSDETQQRVLRRLLTNPGDYLWHPTYGAGLPGFVGHTVNVLQITAISRSQMLRETGVVQSPPPTVTVSATPNGVVTETINYADATTGRVQSLTFPIQ
jgi:hypothetical protein